VLPRALRFSASECHTSGGRTTRMRQMLRSLLAGVMRFRIALPSRVTIVALVVNEQDRQVLAKVLGQELLDVYFAESCEQASALATRFSAPVILLDRDWPGTEWKAAVERLAYSPHHACVILVSGVADAYLWQELVRRDGYDILLKPLRAEDVLRVVKLALSYWSAMSSNRAAPTR
jgi:DNA-binding NtrC family response regulator